ncbi:HepT-like ribonuclease domain-containing protein [Chloracidobacterium thermophilum]|uniref:HepT-like ribonuclease domain-containing protein n=1 Tax=Chloracidobacterium thermophilum TaxID=458033 RepID=UPI0009EB7922
MKRAFVRSLEIVGAASKQIPEDFRQKYCHLEWRAMAGMRDRLIHGYFGVDYDIIWDVVMNKMPALHQAIRQIVEAEKLPQPERNAGAGTFSQSPSARCKCSVLD